MRYVGACPPHRAPAHSAAGVSKALIHYHFRDRDELLARLDHAIGLWHRGLAPHLIVTGGRREGDRTSEAATGRRYAVQHGVPDSAILMESEGRTTAESMRAAVRSSSAILVSDPFHMLRLRMLARRYGIVAYTSPTRTSPISAHRSAALGYMLRESVKIPVVWLTETRADEGADR